MQKLLITSIVVIALGGCSSTSKLAKTDNSQYCYQTTTIHTTDGNFKRSEGITECSDKPRVNHFVKDTGMAKQCRPYQTQVDIKGRVKNVQGFMCQFADGSWQAVDGRYSY